ncbi:sensor histidine kinase [Paenibacillus radicis (ex Gao et al. 2016)]|uniref:histidine kinase n=1 Tax=Paenibacillus radicis (ex Gao et al. 2016) TaxID=1737354 RepID=A0A917HHB5_9BACL|nr:ATP-binding protein [Paenibacillus radicis (ex Gao et al. 2016)]GGG78882.1 two-component sensor histidine kinase [Paenibacillus radicis (ex Gao et al. 2016)]
MRKQGVVLKLFVVTSVLILIVFSFVMLAEGVFFERFYRSSKIHTLERNMNHFAEQFKLADADKQRVSRQLGTFMNQNDASTAIVNSRFERMVIAPYYLVLQVDGKAITVQIPTDGMTIEDIPHGIQAGDHLVVDGIFMDEADTIMHPVTISRESSALGQGLVRVEGRVTDFILPEKRSYNPIYQDGLIDDALREWQPAVESSRTLLHKNGFVHAEWRDNWSGVQYVVLLKSLSEDGSRYLFVMASLQPVGEAVAILKQYFIYLAPIILLLVVLLSFIYSRIVSRPLVSLSRSAARLAQLDFTVQPEIHSKDEFGELSRHMVELSRNLDAALKELTQANVQLQADVEEKQRSEQLRKELVANISHELKTPLGIVKGFAEGLQDGVAGDKKDRYLALIVNETDRMNALIMDMLELSKYEVKAVRLQLRDFSLGVLIQGAAESFSGQLESKQLRIHIDKDDEDELLVTADPVRIEQVVSNLLSNAIRHATENSVITVTIERTAAGGINTVIANAGPPIAEEDLDRIWEQFYRAERSRDRKSGGTGLGLAIVKHIMELHESHFGVMNTKEGVAFYFTLQESRGKHHE